MLVMYGLGFAFYCSTFIIYTPRKSFIFEVEDLGKHKNTFILTFSSDLKSVTMIIPL